MTSLKHKCFLFVICCIVFGCKEPKKSEIKTEAITFEKEGELQLYRADSLLVDMDIEIATSEYETQTGLMYRESMEDRQGMLFIFPDVDMRSFYMKNTQIPLDIIFVDENLKIVSFQKNAEPYNETGLPSEAPAKYVLEINSGLADQWGIQVGDSIAYKEN